MGKYFKITNLVKRNSDEKVTSAIFGERTENLVTSIIVILLVFNFLGVGVLLRFGYTLYIVLTIVFCIFIVFYILTRSIGLGITNNRVVYVKIGHLFYKVKEVHDIPVEKIRNIVVHKFLGTAFVKMSFISDIGKLKRVTFSFRTKLIGPGSYDFNKDSKKIYDRLKEIEKVIDKGDF